MRWLFIMTICLFTVRSSFELVLRKKRAKENGGRVSLKPLIKPPKRLQNREDKHPAPGWQHCIKTVKAVEKWRQIRPIPVKGQQATQFQCTWFINSVRYDGIQSSRQIQISFQKLALGSTDDKGCKQQFVEIIDQGKSQGRFCEKNKPGDYITIGGTARLDVHAEGHFNEWTENKQIPFIISYKTIGKTIPGFRIYTTKIAQSDYDPFHIGSNTGVSRGGKPSINRVTTAKEEDDKEKIVEKKSNSLSVGSIVGIAICCTLVLGVLLIIVTRRCCCKKEKNKPSRESSVREEKNYILPGMKPGGYSYDPISNFYRVPHSNEVIIASESVLNVKKNSKTTINSENESSKSEKKLIANQEEKKLSSRSTQIIHKKQEPIVQNLKLEKTKSKNLRAEKRTKNKKIKSPSNEENSELFDFFPPRRAPKSTQKKRRSKSPSKRSKTLKENGSSKKKLEEKVRRKTSSVKKKNKENANALKNNNNKKRSERERDKSNSNIQNDYDDSYKDKNSAIKKRIKRSSNNLGLKAKNLTLNKNNNKHKKKSHTKESERSPDRKLEKEMTATPENNHKKKKNRTLVRSKMRHKTSSVKTKLKRKQKQHDSSNRAQTPPTRYRKKSKQSKSHD